MTTGPPKAAVYVTPQDTPSWEGEWAETSLDFNGQAANPCTCVCSGNGNLLVCTEVSCGLLTACSTRPMAVAVVCPKTLPAQYQEALLRTCLCLYRNPVNKFELNAVWWKLHQIQPGVWEEGQPLQLCAWGVLLSSWTQFPWKGRM